MDRDLDSSFRIQLWAWNAPQECIWALDGLKTAILRAWRWPVSQLKELNPSLERYWQTLALCENIGLLRPADTISPRGGQHYNSQRLVTNSVDRTDPSSLSAKGEFLPMTYKRVAASTSGQYSTSNSVVRLYGGLYNPITIVISIPRLSSITKGKD